MMSPTAWTPRTACLSAAPHRQRLGRLPALAPRPTVIAIARETKVLTSSDAVSAAYAHVANDESSRLGCMEG